MSVSSILSTPSTNARRAGVATGLSVVAMAFGGLMPSNSVPVLSAAAPATAAAASSLSCAQYAKNLGTFARTGNPAAAINAIRATPGCGDFNAASICSASRKPWGGLARAVVRIVTGGRYSQC